MNIQTKYSIGQHVPVWIDSGLRLGNITGMIVILKSEQKVTYTVRTKAKIKVSSKEGPVTLTDDRETYIEENDLALLLTTMKKVKEEKPDAKPSAILWQVERSIKNAKSKGES